MAQALSSAEAEELRLEAQRLGFSRCGFADASPPTSLGILERWLEAGFHAGMEFLPRSLPLRRDPKQILPDARTAIAVTLDYNQPLNRSPEEGRIARYALGRDYHRVIRAKLRTLGRWLEERYPGASTRPCVDSAPILEREYSHRAGLGWFGKNTMLIDSRRGSWFFLGILLTDLEVPPDRPSEGGCGTCRACIDACPTGAIIQLDGVWQVDARSCISYLTIESPEASLEGKPGSEAGWLFGCDVCQEVCPFNHPRASQPERAPKTQEPDFFPRSYPSLDELAHIDEEEWNGLTEGSAVRRAGWQGLRRNARWLLAQKKRPRP